MCYGGTCIRMHRVNLYESDLDCIYFERGFCQERGIRCNKGLMRVCKFLITSAEAVRMKRALESNKK